MPSRTQPIQLCLLKIRRSIARERPQRDGGSTSGTGTGNRSRGLRNATARAAEAARRSKLHT
eukprot:473946-Alexandrium_andersonii.AAC.1